MLQMKEYKSAPRTEIKQTKDTPRSTELNFLEPIHDLMKIEHELRSVRDEQPVRAIQALGLQLVEFFEERWEMYDDAVSDQSHTLWIYQAYGEVRRKREWGVKE